jgi:electron transport complex protein RnfC
VVDDTRRRLMAALERAAHRTPVRICPLPNKYPQDHPRLLVRAVSGVELPHRQSLEGEGLWCTDAGHIMDIHRAMNGGRPHTWQTVTVSGDAVSVPGNYRFPLGATLRDVVDQVGLIRSPRRIIVGSALRGIACPTPDVVLTKRTRGVVILRDAVRARRDATCCVRCGACQGVCPMRLDPRALLDVAERGRFPVPATLHAEACISCGLCDFVCPASLPLMSSAEQCRDHDTRG